MKIGIIPDTAVGGMGLKRYSLKLIEYLSKKDLEELVIYYSSKRFENELFNIAKNSQNLSLEKIPAYFGDSYFGISFRNFFQLPKKICESDLDLVQDTYNFGPFIKYPFKNNCSVKKIINIHDIAVYLYKYKLNYDNPISVRLSSKIRYEKILPLILKNVDGILVPSENTKNDLIEYFDVPESKLFMVNLGIEFDTFKKLKSSEYCDVSSKYKKDTDKQFLLGTINSDRKIDNVHLVLEVVKMLTEHFNIKLVLIGNSNKIIDKYIQDLNLEEVVIRTGYVSDKELCSIYNILDVFLFLSEYEGFGFPPLEAMACGTLTVVLNRSSLPELVDDGAISLSKKEPEYILNNLINLLENESIRKDISKKGIKRASYFTWDRCINSTINVYENLLD